MKALIAAFWALGLSSSLALAGGGGDGCFGRHSTGEELQNRMLALNGVSNPRYRFDCKGAPEETAADGKFQVRYRCEYSTARASLEWVSLEREIPGTDECRADAGPTTITVTQPAGETPIAASEILRRILAFDAGEESALCETRGSRTVCYTNRTNFNYGKYFIFDETSDETRVRLYLGGRPEDGALNKAFKLK